jgi:hypothetical protein
MTTTTKYFDFPMKLGEKWDLSYVEENLNDKVKIARRTFTYRAVGWEDIEVAAGTFYALKIEVEGDWYLEFLPANASAASQVEADGPGNSVVMPSRNATIPKPSKGRVLWSMQSPWSRTLFRCSPSSS